MTLREMTDNVPTSGHFWTPPASFRVKGSQSQVDLSVWYRSIKVRNVSRITLWNGIGLYQDSLKKFVKACLKSIRCMKNIFWHLQKTRLTKLLALKAAQKSEMCCTPMQTRGQNYDITYLLKCMSKMPSKRSCQQQLPGTPNTKVHCFEDGQMRSLITVA